MMILRWLFVALLLTLAGCATQNDGRQAHVAEDTSRTIDLTHPPRDMWDRIRRGFAIPNLHDERARYWTDYYASHPQSVLLMSQRAGKYLYYIVDQLDQRGMPTELALLPFVESAYDPNALSRSKASGLWQFIPSTGRHYNLQQDIWRDLRRDPVASTQAALDYLAYLYDLQGDWYLALASYNWGEGAVRRAMEKAGQQGQQQPTYLTLDLPDETRNYVPKLQAIKNIIARPEKFGVTLPTVGNTPYFTTVHKSRDMDLAVAAALAEMPFEDFQALNPSFNKPLILGAHNPPLHLPLDKVSTFDHNLNTHNGPLATWELAPVRKGQSLATIAKAHGITLGQLRAVNGLGPRVNVAGSTPLLVPNQGNGIRLGDQGGQDTNSISQPDSIARLISDSQPAVARAAAPRMHTIRKGDTLFALARRYNTSVTALRELNNLKGSRLATGKPLRIPANQ